LGIYFSLDTKLPAGGSLDLSFGSYLAPIGNSGSCDVWPIGTTLDVTKYTSTTPGRI